MFGIMTGLSLAGETLFGPLLKTFLLPALAITALVFAHQYVKLRDQRIVTAATNVCDSRWELGIRKEEQARATVRIAQVQRQLFVERKNMEELGDAHAAITMEMAELRSQAGSTDGRCVSDGVRSLIAKPDAGD